MSSAIDRCECCYHWIDKKCILSLPPCKLQKMCEGWITDAYREYDGKNVCWNCEQGEMDKNGLYCHLHNEMRDTGSSCEHFQTNKKLMENYKQIKKYIKK